MKNRTIDLLKGLCMILIIITHYAWTEQERLNLIILYVVNMAVPILMICSGYVNAISFENKKINSISAGYKMSIVVPKIIRILIPYIIAFGYEVIIDYDNLGKLNKMSRFNLFLCGGNGPGSYYFCIMLQFIYLFPVLYFLIKRYEILGFLLCGIINIIFELFHNAYYITGGAYRLVIFRYILLISYGCFIGIYKEKAFKHIWEILTGIIGVLFIALCNYGGYKPHILNEWTVTSFLACLYIMPIAGTVIKKNGIHFFPIEFIGKASFNIYLVQKIYYYFYAKDIYQLFAGRKMRILLNLAICITIGIGFYLVENLITTNVMKIIKEPLENLDIEKWKEKVNGFICQK